MQDINLHGSDTLIDPSKISLKPPSVCADSAPIANAGGAPTASIETAQSNDEQSTVQNSSVLLLNALWRSPDQVHQIGTLDRSTLKFKNIPVNDISVAVKNALALSAAGTETYFACAEYIISNSRVAANVSGAWAFWVDIDCGENKAAAGKGYLAEADAHVAAKQFCKDAGLPQPTHVVSSGSGLHMYWVLSNVLKREVWQAKAVKLKALTKELGFLADDTRTADIASVLRIPGTLNFKYYPPRLVTLLHASDTFIEQAVMLDAIDNAHAKLCSVAKPKVKIPTAAGKPAPRLKWQSPPSGSMKSDSQEGVKIKAMLDHIDPDSSGYEAWLKILMAIHHETAGSEEGFDLADGWSSKGGAYKGSSEIRVKWNSFKSERENSFNIGTIINMVKEKGIDWRAVCAEAEDPFDVCETTVIHPGQKSAAVPAKVEITSKAAPAERNVTSNPLDKFSLKGRSDEIEKSVVDSVPVLGELALMGQATVFFAAHNTGKTLITNSLLIEAIKDDRVDPSKVYYLNMDDSGNGLLGKNRIADEYGFNVLAEGHFDFNASVFLSIVRNMIENDQARGVVIILDTLKKFVDLMDKGKTSAFTNVIRPFVLKGGTLIALAHTNKHPGKDGKPVYGGVSDIMNDIDCAYTIAPVSDQGGEKIVEFVNVKRRGNVVQSAAYSYCTGNSIPYNEILLSVQPVDPDALEPLKKAEEIRSDAEVISAVTVCIREGVNTKMKLADAVAKRAKISKRSALQVIEKYTGDDLVAHRWKFSVGERGANVFILLDSAASLSSLDELKT